MFSAGAFYGRWLFVVAAVGLPLVLSGCAPADGMAAVTGTVTLGGQPLADATVEFQSVDKGGSSSVGKTDSKGRFCLMYTLQSEGALPGEYTVTICTAETCFDDDGEEFQCLEKVPAKYNDQTTLRRTVEPGRNTIDFEL